MSKPKSTSAAQKKKRLVQLRDAQRRRRERLREDKQHFVQIILPETTLKKLNVIVAQTGETMQQAIARLVESALVSDVDSSALEIPPEDPMAQSTVVDLVNPGEMASHLESDIEQPDEFAEFSPEPLEEEMMEASIEEIYVEPADEPGVESIVEDAAWPEEVEPAETSPSQTLSSRMETSLEAAVEPVTLTPEVEDGINESKPAVADEEPATSTPGPVMPLAKSGQLDLFG